MNMDPKHCRELNINIKIFYINIKIFLKLFCITIVGWEAGEYLSEEADHGPGADPRWKGRGRREEPQVNLSGPRQPNSRSHAARLGKTKNRSRV